MGLGTDETGRKRRPSFSLQVRRVDAQPGLLVTQGRERTVGSFSTRELVQWRTLARRKPPPRQPFSDRPCGRRRHPLAQLPTRRSPRSVRQAEGFGALSSTRCAAMTPSSPRALAPTDRGAGRLAGTAVVPREDCDLDGQVFAGVSQDCLRNAIGHSCNRVHPRPSGGATCAPPHLA